MHIFTNSTSGFPVLASGIFCSSSQYRHSDFTALRQLMNPIRENWELNWVFLQKLVFPWA